ncbi:hypothetical protein F4604DRAFT_1686495 [Suillus subluteus]|nr:hypothetical protein F4604DRAFT_1686495 [Suillus subluteus]
MSLDPADRAPEASEHPNPPQLLTLMDFKEVMKEAKQVMRHKVLLENAMPDTATNMAMAQATLLEAVKRIVPTALLNTLARILHHYNTSVRTICTITTTVRTAFKKEARNAILVPEHYNLTLPLDDPRSQTDHRRDTVGPLLIDQVYLFEDPTIQSPVNHPAVIAMIIRAVWGGILHEVLNFDNIDALNNLISIGGTAVGSSLMEYEEGVHKTVQFAPASRSAVEYGTIQHHNEVVHRTPALYRASRTLRERMPKMISIVLRKDMVKEDSSMVL